MHMRDPLWADLRPGQAKLNDEVRTRLELYIVDKYTNEKLTLRAIAELTGRSHVEVRRVLQKHDVTMRRRGAPVKPKYNPVQLAMYSDEDIADIDEHLAKVQAKPEPTVIDEPVTRPVIRTRRQMLSAAEILTLRHNTTR